MTCTRCDSPIKDTEIICACCAIEPVCESCIEICEGCDEAPICSACVGEFLMLGGPVVCPSCSPGMVAGGRAVILWPELGFAFDFMAVNE